MRFSSIHVHDSYSDGIGGPADFVLAAIDKNMEVLGFSAHSPIPLENEWSMKLDDLGPYVTEVLGLKEKYKKQLKIYLGLELDYIEGMDVPSYMGLDRLPLDYYIGSVHYVFSKKLNAYLTVDPDSRSFAYLLKYGFEGSAPELVKKYYENIRSMIDAYSPSVVAHLDIIMKNNIDGRHFSEKESFYTDEVEKTLELIALKGALVEINTGGMSRGFTKIPYPSEHVLRKCRDKNIGIILSSDAHSPHMLTHGYEAALNHVISCGYRSHFIFEDGKFHERHFNI
jgi:histidinol-phosphatase (PHP family)